MMKLDENPRRYGFGNDEKEFAKIGKKQILTRSLERSEIPPSPPVRFVLQPSSRTYGSRLRLAYKALFSKPQIFIGLRFRL
jgi:hypothetical protein